MSDRSGRQPDGAEKLVRDIRRATRRHFSAQDKIRIVLEGLRGEDSIAGLIPSVLYTRPERRGSAKPKRTWWPKP